VKIPKEAATLATFLVSAILHEVHEISKISHIKTNKN
jgi:hypothetical protein